MSTENDQIDNANATSNSTEMDYIADLVSAGDAAPQRTEVLASDEVVFLGEPDNEASHESADSSDQQASIAITLLERVSIKDIESLKASFDQDWSNCEDLVIDAAQVDSIDTASIQLLVAGINSAKAGGARVAWKAVSEKLRDLATIVDLTRFLDLDSLAESDEADDDDGLVPVF